MADESEKSDTSTILSQLILALQNKQAIPEQVDLPYFRPEKDEASKWIKHVENCQRDFQWSDLQTLGRVGRFLLDSAKRWFDRWSPDTRNWETFRREFLEAFPPKRNLGKLLEEAALLKSGRYNTYETYVHDKLAALKNLRASWSEIDLVELIVHGIEEDEIRNATINRNCTTVSDLLVHLSAFSKNRRIGKFEKPNINPAKRLKPSDDGTKRQKKCFGCGKSGHVRIDCRSSPNLPSSSFQQYQQQVTSTGTSSSDVNETPTCTFCGKFGHKVTQCFTKQAIDKRKRNVNFCSTSNLPGTTEVTIDGKSFCGLIDTGSDVSLISDKFAYLFVHKIQPCQVSIKGIASGCVDAVKKFTADTIITGEFITITYLIVPDCALDYDVFIGRDIFKDHSLETVTDYSGSRVVRRQLPGIHRVLEVSSGKKSELRVPSEHREAVASLLNRYAEMSTRGSRVNCVKNESLQIRLEKDVIVNRPPYRLAVNERAIVRDIISDLLQNNIIRESKSPFSSPILLVKKKDGTHRMCVDYRELNRYTIKDRYPLPLIDDQLDRLGKGAYFTSLDMASGFYQIPIDENSVEETAFVTPDGHYEFLRVPFGLANAPAVFQRAINKALGDLKDSIALVYLDDILIPSQTPDEGLSNLALILEALNLAGFSLNIDKCSFLQNSVEYLGREISADGIRPDKRKIQALLEAPVPTCVKQVRQFMGLAGYFRKFIPGFSTKTACITKLTKQNEPFSWTAKQDSARNYIISCLTSRPLLSIFDPGLPTELHTDASSVGYGAVLLQNHDGQTRVIAYFSKRTNQYEEKYHSYELETLAIVSALKHFRVYLLGIKFTLVTDCNAVKLTSTKRDILPRVARWWTYMQDFTFEIVYRKGSSLPHVDYLSRNPINVRRVTNKNWLYIEQKGSAEVQAMLDDLRNNKLDPNQYVEKEGLLFHKQTNKDGTVNTQWFVPRQSRLGLLRIFHDEQCHVGQEKTLCSISEHFWFPRMRNFVKNYIRHCLICAVKKTRTGPLQGFIKPVNKPAQPFHTLHADCLGPLPVTIQGHKYILVLVDAFTKYCLLLPMKTVTTKETQEQLQSVIALFGTPKRLIMDAGSNFKNTTFPKYLDQWHIEYHYVTPDVHRGNGQVERYMRTIMNLIRIETQVKSEWSNSLWKIQLVLNTTIQKTTKTTPLQLLLGIDSSTPLIAAILKDLSTDLTPIRDRKLDRQRVANLLAENSSASDNINRKRRDSVQYKVGEFVLMHRDSNMHISKSNYEFLGPYEIVKCLANGRYELKKVGTNIITKAAKEQLRRWPSDWALSLNLSDLLDIYEMDEVEEPTESDGN